MSLSTVLPDAAGLTYGVVTDSAGGGLGKCGIASVSSATGS